MLIKVVGQEAEVCASVKRDLLQGKRDLLQGKRDLLILAYLSGACYIPHIRMYLEAREW